MMPTRGAWLSAGSWENFATYFGKRGFDVSTPEWPGNRGDVEDPWADAEELRDMHV